MADAALTEGDDALASAREALARQDWQGAAAAARDADVDTSALEAARADLLAEASWWLGDLETCTAERERAFRLYDELGDARRAGQCAVWLWEHHAFWVRPAMASGWLRRARRALEGHTSCEEYGSLILREAEVAHGSGELDAALALTSEALELGRSLRSADLEAEALQGRGRVLVDAGQLADGLGHLDEAMLFAVEGRLRPYSTGKVYCSMIAACEEVGDFDRAAEWTEATLRWAEEHHPLAIFPGICRVHRAVVLKRRGALADAEVEAARACVELRVSHIANSAAAYAEVGDIRRRLGDLAEAEEAFDRSQQIRGGPCGGLALLRLAQGQVDEAMSVITSCAEGASTPLARAALLPMLVHVAVAAGQVDLAAEALAELEDIVTTFDTATLQATARSTRGRLELARHDPAAIETLRSAAERWRSLEVPYEEATARTLLGQALRDAGEEAAATESFAAAAALFDHIGARLDARRVHEDTKASLPGGLTEREAEVLRLIAAGMTNNEIAGELYLSAKTVSRHLSNIFTKIGVTSRAAATAYAFEHHLVTGR